MRALSCLHRLERQPLHRFLHGAVYQLTIELIRFSSTVKSARKCLRTHDLVVSHLSYDDVNENEVSIENALDLLWERVKPSGVMIVLLEGTYHYKRLGHGLALLSIKGSKSM